MAYKFEILGEIRDLVSGTIHSSAHLRSSIDARKKELRGSTFKEGEIALIRHGNSARFFIDLFSIWELGGCAVPIDPALPPVELSTLVALTQPKIILEPERVHLLETAQKTPGCLLLYTSGTLGRPKGVLHSYSGLQSRIKAWEAQIPGCDLEKSLCILPTHFGHGLLANCLFPLLKGSRLHLLPPFDFKSAAMLSNWVDEYEITFLSSVPAVWEIVRRFSEPLKKKTLKRVHCASAPLSVDLWKEVHAWSQGARVVNAYGLTEVASWVAGSEGTAPPPRNGFVGKPWNSTFEIRDGEIWVKTESLMLGYYGQEDLTREIVKDGWLRTGDLGELDHQGNLTLTGRLKTQINRAGMKISPEEVEQLLQSHPSVIEACAFGAPDPISGELVAAAVVLKDNPPTFAELEAWCREKLSPFKVPTRWFALSEIPKSSRGKINRARVAEMCGKTES